MLPSWTLAKPTDTFGLAAYPVAVKVGVWYELAFHDITQCNGCGCTRFNMTRHGNVIEDMLLGIDSLK